jgi:hypothetical protein
MAGSHNEGMNTTYRPTVARFQRELAISYASLRNAEALRDMLVANPLPGNAYYDDAVQRADELAGEMQDDLDDVMTRALEAGFGPEDFS